MDYSTELDFDYQSELGSPLVLQESLPSSPGLSQSMFFDLARVKDAGPRQSTVNDRNVPSDKSLKYAGRTLDIENNARDQELFHNATPQLDGLYHCPWEGQGGCQHKPEKLKCNYDKFVDSHLKPYRCNIDFCEQLKFSSTACLLRHQREVHAMHGHINKPILCTYEGCDRGVSGNGFPRPWNLHDHMKRVHIDIRPPSDFVDRPPRQRNRKRKIETEVSPIIHEAEHFATRIKGESAIINDYDEGREFNSALYQDEPEHSPGRDEGKTGISAPFTDSGYKSAPNLEHYPCVQSDPRKSPPSPNVLATGNDDADETKTLYSMGSIVDIGTTRKYIVDLSSDMFEKLRPHFVDPGNRTALSKNLPELIKAFAVKICHDFPSQENRNITAFVHKRHQDISMQLDAMFNLDNDDELDRDRGQLDSMTLLEKIEMWRSSSAQEQYTLPCDDLFEGVKDDEEYEIDQSKLFEYHKIVLGSPAYKWFLTTVAKESVLKLETDQIRIRHRILDKLPTGTISKRRAPDLHQVTFKLEWHHSLVESLRNELSEDSTLPVQLRRASIIVTGSTREAQGLTVKQYLAQTWPMTGIQIFDILRMVTTNGPQEFHVGDVGSIQLHAKIFASDLLVTATGPAYFVADCGEQLAWIVSALWCTTQSLGSHCLPSIASFKVDATPVALPCIKYQGYCNIKFEFTQPGASKELLRGMQSFSRGLLRESTLILGFPIRRQPEGYSGLELSFDTILGLLEAPGAELSPTQAFIKGLKSTLILIKHTDDVFLWKFDHSSADSSSCCAEHCISLGGEEGCGALEYRALKTGRHIISQCTGDATLAQELYRLRKNLALVDSTVAQSRFLTQIDLADKSQISSRSLSAMRNNRDLCTHPNSLNTEGTAFNNYPSTLRIETLKVPESLSQKPNLLSTGPSLCQVTSTSGYSLDSDMFSISGSSDDFEPGEWQGTFHLIINKISQQLYAGFRTSTTSPPSNNQRGSVFVASTDIPIQCGNSSGSSTKRKSPQEEEDDAGEDGSNPRRPKKLNLASGEYSQKGFACPYLKKDMVEYRSCGGFSLNRIRDVKLHLHRKHTPERYCQRCQATDFPDKESLQSHIVTGECSPKDPTMLSWISYEQRHELHKKSKPKIGGEDQWFAIWEVLFPGHERPSSVYVDTELALEMRRLREQLMIQGPTLMIEVIRSDPAWLSLDITEEQREIILRRATVQVINNLLDDWCSNPSSAASNSPRDGSSGRTQTSRYETPANSMVDSGVGMAGPSSSGEQSRFQIFRSNYHAPFGSSTGGFEFTSSQPEAAHDPLQRSPPQHSISPVTATASSLPQSASSVSFSPITEGQGLPWQDQFNGIEMDPPTMFQPQLGTHVLAEPEDMIDYFSHQPHEDLWNVEYSSVQDENF